VNCFIVVLLLVVWCFRILGGLQVRRLIPAMALALPVDMFSFTNSLTLVHVFGRFIWPLVIPSQCCQNFVRCGFAALSCCRCSAIKGLLECDPLIRNPPFVHPTMLRGTSLCLFYTFSWPRMSITKVKAPTSDLSFVGSPKSRRLRQAC
jgi:hypothetical protein